MKNTILLFIISIGFSFNLIALNDNSTYCYLSNNTLNIVKSSPDEGEPMIYNYKVGSYVDLEGNVKKGLIYFADLNPTTVVYKEKITDKKAIRLNAKDVKSFLWFDDMYESLKGKFYKRLNRDETKIKIYRNYHMFQTGRAPGLFRYYVQIENKLELTYFWDSSIKNINKKVGAYLSDCPELSAKVKNKDQGYKRTPGKANLKLWLKIAKEYENCIKE